LHAGVERQRPLKAVTMARVEPRRQRIGLALAGGGPLGAIYEIGVLSALAEALRGFDFNEAEVYVGVSAGSFIAAGLANGYTPQALSRLFIEDAHSEDRFDPALLLRPALREYARRLASLPPLAARPPGPISPGRATRSARWSGSAGRCRRGSSTATRSTATWRASSPAPGRPTTSASCGTSCISSPAELDTGESVAFGAPGVDHVPISRAVQASSALPGLFPPVEIGGHYFVDGALRKTLHASVALAHGVDLLICVNPLVPYYARQHSLGEQRPPPS
jgi:NTE family protein